MNFKKYNSIENTYQKKVIEQIYFHEFDKDTYVVQEKVHGSNFSLITDGKTIQAAKRSGLLQPDESFYNFQYVVNKYTNKVLNLFKSLKIEDESIETVTIFGELFGGFYNHADVKPVQGMTKVQKGIDYCPENEFYAFDILINGQKYLDVNTCNQHFQNLGFFYAKTLLEGSLEDALNYPCAFNSLIPKWKSFPELEENVCEGVIIKPMSPRFFGSGSRLILKNKNEKWTEKAKKTKQPKEDNVLSEVGQSVWEELKSFITLNRVNNVLSKEGEFTPKMIGRLIGLTTQDVREDFFKEFEHVWLSLDKSEQKKINKMMNNQVVKLIKTEWMGMHI